MARQYKAVQFNPSDIGKADASKISQQMESILNEQASQGWLFQGYSGVDTVVKPGCLNPFANAVSITVGVLVFYREV